MLAPTRASSSRYSSPCPALRCAALPRFALPCPAVPCPACYEGWDDKYRRPTQDLEPLSANWPLHKLVRLCSFYDDWPGVDIALPNCCSLLWPASWLRARGKGKGVCITAVSARKALPLALPVSSLPFPSSLTSHFLRLMISYSGCCALLYLSLRPIFLAGQCPSSPRPPLPTSKPPPRSVNSKDPV